MSKLRAYNIGSLNLKVSPLLHKEGELIRSLNVEKDTIGAIKKRPGYITFLGTPDNSQVTSLFSWLRNNGTQLWVYRKSGSILYYSTQGTGVWTVCGNGTLTANSRVGHAVLDDVMIVGDGTAVTRHSSDGTSFTNTTGAPLAEHFTIYQGRVYAARGTATSGSNTDLFYSTVGTASDWTTDSTSIRIPGAGRVNSVFKSADRVVATKDSGAMFRYDGDSLLDMATTLGPSSPYSIAEAEGFNIYLTRDGLVGYGGVRPEIISGAVEEQIYDNAGSAIVGTVFDNAPGAFYRNNYYCGIGTVTDSMTNTTIPDCILRYDFEQNEFGDWAFANRPYSFHSYRDTNGSEQLIFGDNGGQCYQYSGTATSDNGASIESAVEGVLHFGVPESDKKFNYIWAFTNPGCQAKVQVAITDTFTRDYKSWVDLKQTKDGVMEARFPADSRGKLLFWRVYESSQITPWHLLGITVDVDLIERNHG